MGNATPADPDVQGLLQRITQLRIEKEIALEANESASGASDRLKEKILAFLKRLGSDKAFLSPLESLEGLADNLMLLILGQRHDIECLRREANRLGGIIEYIQSESWDLEKDKRELAKKMALAELELETLKAGNKRDARKRR